MKILLIDNDKEMAASIQALLEYNHFETDVATDGIKGYEMAGKEKYDVVIMDPLLKGVDGFQLCKDIRQTKKETRILNLSSLDSYEDKVMSYLSGADNFLSKSFEHYELHLKLIRWVKNSSPVNDRSFSLE